MITDIGSVFRPCNRSRLRVNCSSRLGCSSYSSCKSSFIIKRVVMAGLLSARLNLLVDQRPTVREWAATLLHDTLGYVQNIRSLEYCACTLK
jgi:hypothetical protein